MDEELQEANEREWDGGESDIESGVLIGVGTRNQRGAFLAHGGAGGPAVVMGVGYVEGAEEVEKDREVVSQPKKKKSPKPKRKIRR